MLRDLEILVIDCQASGATPEHGESARARVGLRRPGRASRRRGALDCSEDGPPDFAARAPPARVERAMPDDRDRRRVGVGAAHGEGHAGDADGDPLGALRATVPPRAPRRRAAARRPLPPRDRRAPLRRPAEEEPARARRTPRSFGRSLAPRARTRRSHGARLAGDRPAARAGGGHALERSRRVPRAAGRARREAGLPLPGREAAPPPRRPRRLPLPAVERRRPLRRQGREHQEARLQPFFDAQREVRRARDAEPGRRRLRRPRRRPRSTRRSSRSTRSSASIRRTTSSSASPSDARGSRRARSTTCATRPIRFTGSGRCPRAARSRGSPR